MIHSPSKKKKKKDDPLMIVYSWVKKVYAKNKNSSVNLCLRVYIKFFIFENNFLELKKLLLFFQFSRNFFLKMKINMCPKDTHS